MKKENKDIREYPSPPFHEPRQHPPASEQEMDLKPDHGETSYKGYNRMTDKCVVITGGDSGIGKAIAIAFAREGADVVISYLSDVEDDDAKGLKMPVEKFCFLKGILTIKQYAKL